VKNLFFLPWPTRAVSDVDATLTVDDYEVAFTALTAPRAANLPNGASIPSGTPFIVKDESGSAGAFEIRVTPSGGETLDNGLGYLVINAPYGSMSLIRRNNAWWTT
jgi:hypothetical protein